MKKVALFSSILVVAVLLSSSVLLAQHITVSVAGTGVPGFNGDGKEAKNTTISGPKDICIDAAGNLYFIDRGNGRIRRRSASDSRITTIAGGGTSTAENVLATSAAISPNYMCIDSHGDIYFTTDNKVRKVDAVTGNIITVAGTGTAGLSGDGGPATVAQVNMPQGIAVNTAGDLFIADRNNNRIRKVVVSTGVISTIAGVDTAGYVGDGGPAVAAALNSPVVVCIGPAGNIYFSDQNPSYPHYDNSVVRKIDVSTGDIATIWGSTHPTGGVHYAPALTSQLGTITGLCFGPDGNLYSNEISCSCRMLDFASDSMFLIAGDFSTQSYVDDIKSPAAKMSYPYGLCIDDVGNIYVADSNNHRIRKIIALTHEPAFAYGDGLFMTTHPAQIYIIDSLLWATDLDDAQTIKWDVVAAPTHGTMSSVLGISVSVGDATTVKPFGSRYISDTGYLGIDSFKVRVTDYTNADTITIYTNAVADETVGVATVPNTPPSEWSIFPNPASSVLNISWNNNSAANVVIADITNRVVYHSLLLKGAAQVDVSAYPAGIYMVSINGSEGRKFVKQ